MKKYLFAAAVLAAVAALPPRPKPCNKCVANS